MEGSLKNNTTKKDNKKTGNLGESIAAKILVDKGFCLLERNYRISSGEIDIIAKKEGVIHFVEVKTFSREKDGLLTNNDEYRPEELVTREKVEKIRRVANFYLFSREIIPESQIDVMAIIITKRDKKATYTFLDNIE